MILIFLDCGMQCSAVSTKGSGSSPPPPPPPPSPSRHFLSERCVCARHERSAAPGGEAPIACAHDPTLVNFSPIWTYYALKSSVK